MNDIVTILRDISNETDIDADLAEACRDGAGEIEKLRHRVRFQDSVIRSGDVAALTDAEREAVERARRLIASTMPYESQQGAEDYQALSGLLERMK